MNKIVKIPLLFLSIIITLTGCIKIPFNKLILDHPIENDIEIPCIDLNKDNINDKDIIAMQSISEQLFNTIGKKDYYDKNKKETNAYISEVKDLFTIDYYNELIKSGNKNSLFKIINNINNYEYKNCNVIEASINNLGETDFITEIISTGDSKEFIINKVLTSINDEFKITKLEVISEDNMELNTTTPLTKDSFIPTNLIKEKDCINRLFESMKNKALYKNQDLLKIDTLINNLNLKDISSESLLLLFKAGRGEFNNFYVTKYTINNKNSMALSEITLTFINGNKKTQFSFIYSRLTNQINDIIII